MSTGPDYTLHGQRFGRLTVYTFMRTDPKKGHIWWCRCDCGAHVEKSTGKLRDKNNPNISCGCAAHEQRQAAARAAVAATTKFRHPLKSKMKNLYRNMVERCHDPKNKRYADYGGRGIAVCEEWRADRYAFYDWCINNGVAAHLQIDRRENNGPYSPDNCRFVTQFVQANNSRKNRRLEWNGETHTVTEWARKLGVAPKALQHRVDRGWTTERIFNQPYRCTS